MKNGIETLTERVQKNRKFLKQIYDVQQNWLVQKKGKDYFIQIGVPILIEKKEEEIDLVLPSHDGRIKKSSMFKDLSLEQVINNTQNSLKSFETYNDIMNDKSLNPIMTLNEMKFKISLNQMLIISLSKGDFVELKTNFDSPLLNILLKSNKDRSNVLKFVQHRLYLSNILKNHFPLKLTFFYPCTTLLNSNILIKETQSFYSNGQQYIPISMNEIKNFI